MSQTTGGKPNNRGSSARRCTSSGADTSADSPGISNTTPLRDTPPAMPASFLCLGDNVREQALQQNENRSRSGRGELQLQHEIGNDVGIARKTGRAPAPLVEVENQDALRGIPEVVLQILLRHPTAVARNWLVIRAIRPDNALAVVIFECGPSSA